jgi:hypothetical protein
MARAVLRIEVDTSAVARAMGDLRGVARSAQSAMTSEVRREAAQRDRIARDETRHRQRLELEAVRTSRSAQRQQAEAAREGARERSRTADRASREEIARQNSTTRLFIAAERNRTEVMLAEERRRTAAARSAARERAVAAQREARSVRQAGRDIGFGVRRGLNVGGDAALNVGRTAYSEIRDARRQRAQSEHTLNSAFYQAGIGGAEAASVRARLEREVTTGSLRGLSMEDVASGIAQAQTQFNVLGGASPEDRRSGMNRQIELLQFARNTYQDPGEILRVAGMLQEQGVTGADQTATIRSMTGMAQAGAIELGNMTREALGPLMQNIARSVTSGMNAEQRSRAVRSATLETMAVGEITSRAGASSRDALNALAKTRGSITNERTQENLYTRLMASGAQGSSLASSMFTVRDGRARLNEGTTAVSFLSQLVAGFGGDTNRVGNLLSAGGQGAPMVLDAQQRRLLLLLASQGRGGHTIAENVSSMQEAGSRFGAADEARGAALRNSEQLTKIQTAEEQRLQALNDANSATVRFARTLDDFATRNPIGSAAIQTGGGLLGGILGGALFSRIGNALAGTRVGAAIAGTPAAQAAAGTAGGIGLAGAALGVAGVASVAGAARTAITGQTVGGGTASTTDRVMAGLAALTPGAAMAEMGRQIGSAVASAISNARVTMDPHTAAHAASQNAAPGAQ